MDIVAEIKESFKRGNTLIKLIYINLAVFVVAKLGFVFYLIFFPNNAGVSKLGAYYDHVLSYVMLQSDLKLLLYRPWSVVTYMFLHFEFLHILFNLLVLFWFGRIFLQYLTEKQLLTTYLLGGIAGAALFVLSYNVFPGLVDYVGTTQALGASAAVMAIVIAIASFAPNYEVYLFFIGRVKIKYIATAYVVLDVLQLASSNTGGHIAHLGGALYGLIFATQLQKGKDVGRGFDRFLDTLAVAFKRKPHLRVTYKGKKADAKEMTDMDYNKYRANVQKEVDRILDKIAKSGYDSLSKKEKEILFKMSDKR